MREISNLAGKVLKIKDGVGISAFGEELSGKEFRVEDYVENVMGTSWMFLDDNPAALEYAIRTAKFGENNKVPFFSNEVLYGKVGLFGHMFHICELCEN